MKRLAIYSTKDLLHNPLVIFGALILCSALNIGLNWLNYRFIQSPLFFDSIFTAVGASLFGPIVGMGIGLATNVGMEGANGMSGLFWPFAPCNMATGLIIGLMARKDGFPRPAYITVSILLVTIANAILGSFIATFMFSGYTGVQIDYIIYALTETGMSLGSATFWGRIPTNLIDKMIAVYAAVGVLYLVKKREKNRV